MIDTMAPSNGLEVLSACSGREFVPPTSTRQLACSVLIRLMGSVYLAELLFLNQLIVLVLASIVDVFIKPVTDAARSVDRQCKKV